jgi:membrane-associated HD superfamily phosphohydrolase
MSLRIIPLMIIPFILYNVIALMGGGGVADDVFRRVLFKLPMINNPNGWSFSWGDLIILITMVTLFIELLKSTYTSTSSMVDHGLSMIVFIACLIQFIISPTAQTSVFFFVMIAALIDVVAGFMIGIRTARRDLNIGSDS